MSEQLAGNQEIQEQSERVNQLLHELEGMVDDTQHALLTELFSERAVLAAMRARAELDEVQKRKANASQPTEKLSNTNPDEAAGTETKGESAI